jgi:hypothetical protein
MEVEKGNPAPEQVTTPAVTASPSKWFRRVTAKQALLFGLSLVLSFAISIAVCGLAGVAYAFFSIDPHCHCHGLRTYLAKQKYAEFWPVVDALALITGLALCVPIYRFLRSKILVVSAGFGILTGVLAWFVYGWTVSEDYQQMPLFSIPVNEIAGPAHPLIALNYLAPLITWKFLCALGVFLVISILCGLISISVTSASAQEQS